MLSQLVGLELMTSEIFLKEILKVINTQVLEATYTLNLGQLLEVILDIEHYTFNLVSSKPISLEPLIALITIDHKMVVIHVQIGRNFIEDFLFYGGFVVNIIIEKLWMQLGLTKPKLEPYNSHMVDQKPLLNL